MSFPLSYHPLGAGKGGCDTDFPTWDPEVRKLSQEQAPPPQNSSNSIDEHSLSSCVADAVLLTFTVISIIIHSFSLRLGYLWSFRLPIATGLIPNLQMGKLSLIIVEKVCSK